MKEGDKNVNMAAMRSASATAFADCSSVGAVIAKTPRLLWAAIDTVNRRPRFPTSRHVMSSLVNHPPPTVTCENASKTPSSIPGSSTQTCRSET